MRTIIAGSRTIEDYSVLLRSLNKCGFTPTLILCGGANGADSLGERYALDSDIPIEYFLADWDNYGKSAGYIRNKKMAENAQALIALWDGKSKGTKHMIDLAEEFNLTTYVRIKKVRC